MIHNNDDGLPAMHPKKLQNSQLNKVSHIETAPVEQSIQHVGMPTNSTLPPFDLKLTINSQDDVSECTHSTTTDHSKAILTPTKTQLQRQQNNLLIHNNNGSQHQQQIQPQQQSIFSPAPKKFNSSNSPKSQANQQNQVHHHHHQIANQNELECANDATMMNNNDNVFNRVFIQEKNLNTNGKSSCPNGDGENAKNGKHWCWIFTAFLSLTFYMSFCNFGLIKQQQENRVKPLEFLHHLLETQGKD
jgi:hypothetical protein